MLSLVRPLRVSFSLFQSIRLLAAKPAAAAAAPAGGKAAAPAGGKAGGKAGAKGAKGKPGDKGASKGPSAPTLPPISSMTDNIIRGVNIVKGKTDPPLLADSEYPAWLWQYVTERDGKIDALVAESEVKLRQTEEARVAAVGAELDLLSLLEQRKKLRKDHKKDIKDQNFMKAKKK